MSIKPNPYICKCSQCNWEIGIAPKSDALMPWDYFDCCPECGNKELINEPLGLFKEQLWRLTGKMSDSKRSRRT